MAAMILQQVSLPEDAVQQRDAIQKGIQEIQEEIKAPRQPTRRQLVSQKIARKSAPVTTGVKKPRRRLVNLDDA